jgi:multiple sugar transport system permease protein
MSIPPSIIPHEDPLINYRALFTGELFGYYMWATPEAVKFVPRAIMNSLFVSSVTAVGALLTGSWAAYPIARINFRGRDKFMPFLIFLRCLPAVVTFIPLLLMMQFLNMGDNFLGLIVPYIAVLLPYNIWMLNSYFQTIPMEIEDSAKVDGCNRWQIINKIILPLSTPGLAAVFLFNFISIWNDFFWALIITKSEATYTLPVVIGMFSGQHMMTPWDLMLAAAVIGALPTAVICLIFQKYLVSGLMAGAVKG